MSGRGLTLAELLVALAVLAVVTGIGVPYTLGQLPTYRVNGAVRQLLADLRYARALAVERGDHVVIEFHQPARDRYRIGVDRAPADGVVDEPLKVVDLADLYPGVRFTPYGAGASRDGAVPGDGVSFEGDTVTLLPSGRANRSGSAFLCPARDLAAGRTDRERRVTVVNTTGRARSFRWAGGGWE